MLMGLLPGQRIFAESIFDGTEHPHQSENNTSVNEQYPPMKEGLCAIDRHLSRNFVIKTGGCVQ